MIVLYVYKHVCMCACTRMLAWYVCVCIFIQAIDLLEYFITVCLNKVLISSLTIIQSMSKLNQEKSSD